MTEWSQNNKERIAEYNRQYWLKNKKLKTKITLLWRKRNPERVREMNVVFRHRRRAIRIGVGGCSYSVTDLEEILKVQKYRCIYCGANLRKVQKHLDHIFPLLPRRGKRAGLNVKSNLQYLCEDCNLFKSNKDPVDFVKELNL